jgi:hypothetical protein
LLIVALIAGLAIMVLFAFTFAGLVGEAVAAVAVIGLLGKLTVHLLRR